VFLRVFHRVTQDEYILMYVDDKYRDSAYIAIVSLLRIFLHCNKIGNIEYYYIMHEVI